MRFGDLAFFAACGGLGHSGGLGPACGFDALCRGSAGCLFGLAQSTSHGRVGVVNLMGAGSLRCVTCSGIGGGSSGFGFCLGQQCLLTDLLGSTMSQLRTILPARGREVAILCSVKIRPGVEDRHIFRGLRYCLIIDPVHAARIHNSESCKFR